MITDIKVTGIESLENAVKPYRQDIVQHPVFYKLENLEHLKVFMNHHVYAVCDFMILLKSLQRELTSIAPVWVPKGDPTVRRFINMLVLEEETDVDENGNYASHFELYHSAMKQALCDTTVVEQFIRAADSGQKFEYILKILNIPEAAKEFMRTTWDIVEKEETSTIAVVFAFSREEIIPDMFRRFVAQLHNQMPDQLSELLFYLERHIHLDEDEHHPMSRRMCEVLCGDDEKKWQKGYEALTRALIARRKLWDGVLKELNLD